jgi:hypothetical protein
VKAAYPSPSLCEHRGDKRGSGTILHPHRYGVRCQEAEGLAWVEDAFAWLCPRHQRRYAAPEPIR